MAEINDDELAQLRQQAEAGQSAAAALEQTQQQLADGLTRYADQVRAANPDIPADAIAGDNFEAIAQSAQRARAIADAAIAARSQQQQQPPAGGDTASGGGEGAAPPARTAPQVPAGGAVTRSTPNTEGMSAGDKIRLGLELRARQQ